MENYKTINRELVMHNYDLKSKNAELQKQLVFLQKELNYANQKIIEQIQENSKMKETVQNMVAYSYQSNCKIIKDASWILDCNNKITRNAVSVSVPSINVISPSNSNSTVISEKSFYLKSKTNIQENLLTEESGLIQKVTISRGKNRSHNNSSTNSNEADRSREYSTLVLRESCENQETNNDQVESDENIYTEDIYENSFKDLREQKSESRLATIIEESPYQIMSLRSGKNITIFKSNTLTKENKSSYVDSEYTEYTSENTLTTAQQTFYNTAMNIINAPSSTPCKKKLTNNIDIHGKTLRVKLRRLKLKIKTNIKNIKEKQNISNQPNILKSRNNLYIENTSKTTYKSTRNNKKIQENILNDEITNRPKRRAAQMTYKPIPLNTKMRYDPKENKISIVRI